MNEKQPGWRDECVSVLRTFVEREEEIARNSYAEYDGLGRPLKFTARSWRRGDRKGYETVVRAKQLIERATTMQVYVVKQP